ncbi:MAG: trehalose-6-phosphate synthase [Desulfobacteraceae bacterium]|nr:MAG: trehalose-6-phosphate synthase [Desulfobacteraceae bacterium]
MLPPSKNRLVIVSNRLPVVFEEDENGRLQLRPGSGGLVTALAPVLRNRGGLWIGWPGTADTDGVQVEKLLEESTKNVGYNFKPVVLSKEEVEGFYYGFANEILWPLFHDLQTRCNFDPTYWKAYRNVNRKFAEVIIENIKDEDHIWIHDYHLMTVAHELREMGISARIGYFLHIPFPPMDLFINLPWRFQILHALLSYDLVGFQTQRDRRNFVQCVENMLEDVRIQGEGQVLTAQVDHREVRIGNFPVSIDYNEFFQKAATREVEELAFKIRKELTANHIVLGIDRLDYTKGIPERLTAFRNLLERYPEIRKKVSLIQIVVPSRVNIPKYHDLKSVIEGLVGEINGRFTQPGWVPIHYIFRSIDRTELIAYYRAAQIALITPLKDGMNLVAKEYSACNVDESGVLILSEFAGAAAQLKDGALLVNPYDVEGVADTLFAAMHMDIDRRREKVKILREAVRSSDIYSWVDSFLEAAFAHDLEDFPPLAEYIPTDRFVELGS